MNLTSLHQINQHGQKFCSVICLCRLTSEHGSHQTAEWACLLLRRTSAQERAEKSAGRLLLLLWSAKLLMQNVNLRMQWIEVMTLNVSITMMIWKNISISH